MATQRIKESYDKENPPYPLLSSKKVNSLEESTPKKKILGEPFQTQIEDEETRENSPLGDRLMQRKRAFQEQRKLKEEFSLKLFDC